jgi:hypothetical protein
VVVLEGAGGGAESEPRKKRGWPGFGEGKQRKGEGHREEARTG